MSQIIRYFPSILITLAIIILSLVPIPEVPSLVTVPLWDKWVHFVMYGGLCCVYWYDFFKNGHSEKQYSKWLIWIVLLPVALGGLLEICQCIADGVGVLLALPLGLFLFPKYFKNRNANKQKG